MMTELMAATMLAILPAKAFDAALHGEATLKSPVSSVAAGAPLVLDGEDFAPRESYKLVLRGALTEYELGTVSAKPDSTFTLELTVPDEARTGQYKVVAVASDGDDVATLDMIVTPMEVMSEAGHQDMAPAGEHPDHSPAEARADEIVVQRSRTRMEWGVIGLAIGLAGGLGVGLLRRP